MIDIIISCTKMTPYIKRGVISLWHGEIYSLRPKFTYKEFSTELRSLLSPVHLINIRWRKPTDWNYSEQWKRFGKIPWNNAFDTGPGMSLRKIGITHNEKYKLYVFWNMAVRLSTSSKNSDSYKSQTQDWFQKQIFKTSFSISSCWKLTMEK